MKVYILTGESFPNGMAAVSRIKSYASAIKEGGVEVEILIYRRTEAYGCDIRNINIFGNYNGVPYHYIPNTTLRSRFRLIRFVYDKCDQRKAGNYLKRMLKKGDVLFFYMAGRADLILRYMNIAHKCGVFCVHDLCELPYGAGIETENTIKMRKFSLSQVFPLFDGVVSISDTLMELAKQYTKPSCLHIKVPILVDFNQFYLADKSVKAQVPYIFHAGTLYQQKDGILGMIEAFGKAKQRINFPIKYILTGELSASSHPDKLKALIRRYQLEDSVEFVGYLYRDQIIKYLQSASLVISNRPKSQQDYYGFSTKVGEYLASGTPLLTTNWGEAMNWLEDGKSAYIVEPENTDALADAIVQVFNNMDESRKIGLAGQEVCRKCFDYRNWSKPLVEFLNQLDK